MRMKKGIVLPVILDRDAVPRKFAAHQATDLSDWDGRTDPTEVQAFFRRLASLVPPLRIDTVRPGYDSRLLGKEHEIPLPGVTGSTAVLRYNHSTAGMNPGRRLAHYSAYNVGGSQLVHIDRGPDRWAPDPLLPKSRQRELSLPRHSPYDRRICGAAEH